MISRTEAIEVLNKYLKDEINIKRAIAVEAILRKVAKRLNRDQDLWAITGLLHNIDFEYTEEDPEKRGIISSKILDGMIPERGINAIRGTNYIYSDYVPVRSIDKALIAAISITDLIYRFINSTSSQKISELDLLMLYGKLKDTDFITNSEKKRIELVKDIGLDEQEFLKISLDALKEISDELGF